MVNRSKISLSFYIKRTKLLQNGEAPIYVKIAVDKGKEEISIAKSVKPELWNTEKNGVIGNTKEAKEINAHIQYVRLQISNHINMLRDEVQDLTAKHIKNSFLGIKSDEKTLVSVYQEHNDNVKKLVGKDFAKATYVRYVTNLTLLKQYMSEHYKVKDIPLHKVTPDFIRGFEIFLKTTRNCRHNTSTKYLKNLKKITSICFGNGWMKIDPFANIKFHLDKVDKGFLTERELEKIRSRKFDSDRLQLVADVFLFGCYTGYAYSDLKRLSPENLVTSDDGKLWIHARRYKTDMVAHVPLLPAAKEILDKYRFHEYCTVKNVLLPVLSNQKLNSYLKEIADVCGIEKEITTHMARHTFATTITLNNDIPIESVSKMLGHSSISMTQNYARLLDKKVGRDMDKLKDKYTNGKPPLSFEICPN
ncbi:MAG: site-specific integrase [Bacteroidales bacterium]|nr:site-specific integrase [Bacteroidales bacterium]